MIEHAGHDEAGVELVRGRGAGDSPGCGRQQHAGDVGRPGIEQPAKMPGKASTLLMRSPEYP
jgi:hypothetical protein